MAGIITLLWGSADGVTATLQAHCAKISRMKRFLAAIQSLLSWKDHPGYLILLLFSLAGYGYWLGFHFQITPSRLFSALFAGLLLVLILLFLYYAAYRWIEPRIEQTTFHKKLMLLLSALLTSLGIGIWFTQSTTFIRTLFLFLEHWLPDTLWNAQRSNGLLLYAPFFILTIIAVLLGGTLYFTFIRMKTFPTEKIQLYSYAFFLLSVTTCIFVTDFLEIPPGEQSIIYWGGTEDYIRYRIRNEELSFIQDLQKHGGFIYGHGPNTTDPVRDYLSQTGFYGSVLKLFQTTTKIDPEILIIGARLLLGLTTAGIFTFISLALKKLFGFIPSLIFSFLCAITYWFIGPSTHLIWFFPTFFISLILSLILYPKVLANRISRKTFLLILFLGQILIFLRGYEYAPVLILSPAISAFYYNLRTGMKFKDILWNGFTICLVGVLSLITVMVLHSIQLSLYFGSLDKAINYLLDRSQERGMSNVNQAESVIEVFQRWMKVKVFYISNRITTVVPNYKKFDQTWNTFGRFHLAAFFGVIFSGVLKIIQPIIWPKNGMHKEEIHQVYLLAITSLAATLASWSWFPAIGHMRAHYHMNGIMYMIPMGIAVFILWGYCSDLYSHPRFYQTQDKIK